MHTKTFLAFTSALTIAAIAATITWHRLQQPPPAQSGQTEITAKGDASAELLAENAKLRERLRELQTQPASVTRTAVAPPADPTDEVAAEPIVASEPRAFLFDDPRYAAVLAQIDWQLMGTVTKDMQPLLAEMIRGFEETGEVPTELQAKLGQLNAELVAQLPAMLASGAPGFGANGAYTHPLFVANTLASTLAAAGHELGPGQQAAIAGLVASFSVETQSIADGQRDFDLEHMLAETEMKDRFYQEVATRLSPEQHAQLFPKGAEHDGANLFGTGLITAPYVRPIAADNPADFARLTSNRLGESLGLDEQGAAAVRSIVERMSTQATDLWQYPASGIERQLQMMRPGRTTTALRHQIAMMREISRSVPLTRAQRQKLNKLQGVFVPLPR